MNYRNFIPLLTFVVFLFSPSLWSYNYLYIHPTTGEPIGWDPNLPIIAHVDAGNLGRLTNAQLKILILEAWKVWQAAPNSKIPDLVLVDLPEEVNGTNYQNYVSLGQCYSENSDGTSALDTCPTQAQKDLQTVIIFDEDRSILDNVLCKIRGCSASAGAKVFKGTSSDPQFIKQGILVLGKFAGDPSTKISAVIGQMVHEIGHLLGLAHSSINQEIYTQAFDDMSLYIPTMFFSSAGFADMNEVTLNPDDIAGISNLYPSDTFFQNTATITGQILKSDGSPMMHVNVIARNVDDPLCEAYSFLSGRICQRPFGTVNSAQCQDEQGNIVFDGSFSFSSLPSGSYTLEVEEVADDNLGLTLAPGLIPSEDIYGDAEFWNFNDQAGDVDHLQSDVITLGAGETKDNMDIVLNNSVVTDNRVQYLPLTTFTPGPGTLCPQEPPIDYATLIGIDESTTSSNNSTTTNPSTGGCSLIR